MNATILSIENRISILRGRDPVGNANIIRKTGTQVAPVEVYRNLIFL